jgi:hypothetical protein
MVILNNIHILQLLHEIQEISRKTELIVEVPHTCFTLENTQEHRVLGVKTLEKFFLIEFFDILKK